MIIQLKIYLQLLSSLIENGEKHESESKTDLKRKKLDQVATASCSNDIESESQSGTNCLYLLELNLVHKVNTA